MQSVIQIIQSVIQGFAVMLFIMKLVVIKLLSRENYH